MFVLLDIIVMCVFMDSFTQTQCKVTVAPKNGGNSNRSHEPTKYCNWVSGNPTYQCSNQPITKGSWWRHQMETLSALLAICAGNSPVTGEFPTRRPVTRSFVVFFDLRLNKRLNKQSWGWWSETPLCPLWRHCNECQQIGNHALDSANAYDPGLCVSECVVCISHDMV